VSSALVTIFLKHAILPRGPQDAIQHTDPGQVLRAINAMLFNEMFGKDLFISMTYVVLDTQTCELQYGNAGHPPLLIRRANGEVESFRTPAPALGINSEVKYCAAACRLEPGDAFLLYTDGITEAGNPEGTFYGWERLSALAARLDGPPPALIDAIAEDLDAFRATQPLSDDVTFMALKLAPQPDARIALSPTPAAAENKEPTPAKSLRYAHTDGCAFLQISGSGTWAESHRMMELFRESQKNEDRLFLLDFSACGHLDSTFLGTLHQLCASSGQDRMPQVELQNLPRSLLKLMSELGLTAVLLHFRPKPRVLPESMALRDEPPPPHPDLGDTVLRAHEALIQADSRNAERFATVLQAFRAKSDS
jgi:anti-anti-sigma regulatory factor